jgi:hypothetical protein
VVSRVPHEQADDDREESPMCFSDIPIRQNTVELAGAKNSYDDNGVWWLALLLKVAVILGNRIRAPFALSRRSECSSAAAAGTPTPAHPHRRAAPVTRHASPPPAAPASTSHSETAVAIPRVRGDSQRAIEPAFSSEGNDAKLCSMLSSLQVMHRSGVAR